jgi:DNA sulfur modification protein DndB
MDERDPLTQVARDAMDKVAFFRGRVNMKRRQLGTRDKEVATFAALRGACVTLAEGIGGVKHGARPVPLPMDRIPSIRTAAVEWFTEVTRVIGPAMENRAQTLASSSSVMAAIGAMGHALVDIGDSTQRAMTCARLADHLRTVRWEKGKAWEGIAGKFGVKGKFSTSGAKDAAYAIYSALSDESSSAYRRIREGHESIPTPAQASEEEAHSFQESESEAVVVG